MAVFDLTLEELLLQQWEGLESALFALQAHSRERPEAGLREVPTVAVAGGQEAVVALYEALRPDGRGAPWTLTGAAGLRVLGNPPGPVTGFVPAVLTPPCNEDRESLPIVCVFRWHHGKWQMIGLAPEQAGLGIDGNISTNFTKPEGCANTEIDAARVPHPEGGHRVGDPFATTVEAIAFGKSELAEVVLASVVVDPASDVVLQALLDQVGPVLPNVPGIGTNDR